MVSGRRHGLRCVNRKMKHKHLLILLFFFLIFSGLFEEISRADPSWIKTGSFAEYQFESTGVHFTNSTATVFNYTALATFRWYCEEVYGAKATLNVSLVFVGENGFALSELIYVNITNREVFTTNYKFVGVTFLWGPTDVKESSKVVLWESPSETVIGSVDEVAVVETAQGKQKVYFIHASGMILGKSVEIIRIYDLDTGIFIDGRFTDDVIFSVLGLDYLGLNGNPLKLIGTNINFGPNFQPNQSAIPLFIVFGIIAFFVVLIVIIYKLRIKNQKHYLKKI
jgi:hypothetical protein